jgi:hypothetical protein
MGLQILQYSGYDLNHGKVWIFSKDEKGFWEPIGWVYIWAVVQEHPFLAGKTHKQVRPILPTLEVSQHILEIMDRDVN